MLAPSPILHFEGYYLNHPILWDTPIQKPRVGKTCGAEGLEFCPYNGDIPIIG